MLCGFLCLRIVFSFRFVGNVVGIFFIECMVKVVCLFSWVLLIFLVNSFLLLVFKRVWFWILLLVEMRLRIGKVVFLLVFEMLWVFVSSVCIFRVWVRVSGDLWVVIGRGEDSVDML